MAIQNIGTVFLDRGYEFSQTVDTTSTGQKDVVLLPPDATPPVITWRGLSTSVVKIQITASTVAEVNAGTAVWVDLGSTSTTGTVQVNQMTACPTAITFVVNTALAGNQGYWAIRANKTAYNS